MKRRDYREFGRVRVTEADGTCHEVVTLIDANVVASYAGTVVAQGISKVEFLNGLVTMASTPIQAKPPTEN